MSAVPFSLKVEHRTHLCNLAVEDAHADPSRVNVVLPANLLDTLPCPSAHADRRSHPAGMRPAASAELDEGGEPVPLEDDRREILGQDLDVELLLCAEAEEGVVRLGVGL